MKPLTIGERYAIINVTESFTIVKSPVVSNASAGGASGGGFSIK